MPRSSGHQYWRYTPTGETWAIQVVNGEPVGACGPLDPREVPPMVLPYLMFHFRDVPWIRTHRLDFTLIAALHEPREQIAS